MLNNGAKEAILQATLDTIAENSISNTSMQMIAQRAGMRQPNLHYYFNTKRELLLQLMEWMQRHYDTLIDRYVNERQTLEGKLQGFFEQEMYVMEHESAYTKASLDLWGLGQSDAQIRAHYAQGYAIWRGRISSVIGDFLPTLAPGLCDTAASMLISMVMGAQIQYLSDPDAFALRNYMECCREELLQMLNRYAENPGSNQNGMRDSAQ